jgi:putative tryptophan/tyrosine transport system substrate-binding protein
MKRREFLAVLGVASTWPLVVRAQQPGMPAIGFLSSGSSADRQDQVEAFLKGLKETGRRVGDNVTIEYRWAEERDAQFQSLAREMVRRRPTVIVVSTSTVLALAAKAATATVPIVFCFGGDPVKNGVVVSMNRPGGNVTGVSYLSTALAPKRLEILRDLLPDKTIVAHLVNPQNANAKDDTEEMFAAGRAIGREVVLFKASSASELDEEFSSIAERKIDVLIPESDSGFFSQRAHIVALTARYKIAAVFDGREYVNAGGLISYGPNRPVAVRLAGAYVGRILNGATPADLPVEQPTTFELAINLKAAKALGLKVPKTLLDRADEVIE